VAQYSVLILTKVDHSVNRKHHVCWCETDEPLERLLAQEKTERYRGDDGLWRNFKQGGPLERYREPMGDREGVRKYTLPHVSEVAVILPEYKGDDI
jgi:hypothetical protein